MSDDSSERNSNRIYQIDSSGDNFEVPPAPDVSFWSTEAAQGSSQIHSITSGNELSVDSSENCPTHGIADPIIDSVSTESSTFANFLPSQEKDQLYFPSVPDFTQEVSDHLLNFCVPDTLAGNSSQHPADPEINDDLIDTNLLNEILAFGFEKAIAVLALTKTKDNCDGINSAINWILEHSNESEYESDVNGYQVAMGATTSTTSSLNNFQAHKMIFVINMNLKMGTGKLAAQVGHASISVYRLAQRKEEGQRALEAWRACGEMKVVVKGQNTEHLLELFKMAKDLGLFAYVVSDAGRTQIPAGSRTVLAIFGPSDLVDSVTGQLKLL